MINKKSNKQKETGREEVFTKEFQMDLDICLGGYRKETHTLCVDLLWDSLHGYGPLGLELQDTTMLDYSAIPDDSSLILLLGHAVYNTLFEFHHARHCSTFCTEESAANKALDAMYMDLRENWNTKERTLDSYLKENWRLVVLFNENDQFAIPVHSKKERKQMTKTEMIELLKTDVAAWNTWRAENPDEIIDLTGANLERADLNGANLIGADFEGANLNGADLEGVNLRHANLEGADLSGAYLGDEDSCAAGGNYTGLNIEGADFTGAKLNGDLLQGAYGTLGRHSKKEKTNE